MLHHLNYQKLRINGHWFFKIGTISEYSMIAAVLLFSPELRVILILTLLTKKSYFSKPSFRGYLAIIKNYKNQSVLTPKIYLGLDKCEA